MLDGNIAIKWRHRNDVINVEDTPVSKPELPMQETYVIKKED